MQNLIEYSREAALLSHSPYSHFRVGAAIKSDSTILVGANVEQEYSPGLLCGERSAVVDGVTRGLALNNPFFVHSVAVSCIDAPEGFTIAGGSPCGACRQVLREFASPEIMVTIDDRQNGVQFRLDELLPNAFRFGPAFDPNALLKTPADIAAIESAVAKSGAGVTSMLEAAEHIASNAYVPHSRVPIGAVVITTDGRAFAGVQVDNSSTGLSIGALHTAVNRAVLGTSVSMRMHMKETGAALLTAVAVARLDDNPILTSMIENGLLAEFINRETAICLGSRKNTESGTGNGILSLSWT